MVGTRKAIRINKPLILEDMNNYNGYNSYNSYKPEENQLGISQTFKKIEKPKPSGYNNLGFKKVENSKHEKLSKYNGLGLLKK